MRASTEPIVRLSCEEQVELRSGAYRARIAPAAGGRVASLVWCGAGDPVDLLVPWDGSSFAEHDWPKAGAFPMLPFANRLPARGFPFRDRIVQPDGAPNGVIQHGVAHRRPWRVMQVSAHGMRMRLEQEASAAWPWAWTAEMDLSVGVDGLAATMRVRNASGEAMPLGMGWHPYHPVARNVAAADLSFTAAARHDLDAHARAVHAGSAPRFAMQAGETAAFSDWTGQAQFQSIRGRIVVSSAGARHLVLHRPAGGDYVCIEPVSVLPGHLGDAASLASGDARQLTWTCRFEPAA